MNIIQSASLIIFIITIIFIATERIERVYTALLSSGAMFIIGAVEPRDFLSFIDIEILGIVIGMMLLVNGAEKSGIFDSVALRILKASKSPISLAIILLTFTAFLSMILNNIGAMLISASITMTMAKALKMKSETLLIFQAIIANVGGMMLLMSSIPNIIVSVAGEISFNYFLLNMAPLAIILLIVTTLLFLRIFRKETQQELTEKQLGFNIDHDIELKDQEAREVREEIRTLEFSDWVELAVREFGHIITGVKQYVTSLILIGTIIGFIVYDLFDLTPTFVALTGGIFMMIYSYDEPAEALREVDWSTVFFLAGLFTMINGMNHIGLIDQISNSMLGIAGSWPRFLPITVMWLSAIPSSLIDNIPMTATFAPILRLWISEGISKKIWWGLVIGANLGGNLTPIGSPSNILVFGVSEREGTPIEFMTFFKHSFMITMIHLLISMIYLYLLYIIH